MAINPIRPGALKNQKRPGLIELSKFQNFIETRLRPLKAKDGKSPDTEHPFLHPILNILKQMQMNIFIISLFLHMKTKLKLVWNYRLSKYHHFFQTKLSGILLPSQLTQLFAKPNGIWFGNGR